MADESVRKKQRVDAYTKYDVTYFVGEGTYGHVYKAQDKKTHKKLAIKKFKQTKEGEGISLTAYREIMLLRELDHENIIKILDITLNPDDKSLSLVMDYAEYDLSEIIRYHHKIVQKPPSPYMVKSLMWQVLNAINYMHSNWVCHRDLKPSNILVMAEGQEQGLVKIADFGLARIFQSPLRPLWENGVVVTIWYRAPELLLGSKHYTRSVDIWAIGCIFAELLTTNPLFPGKEKDTKNPNLFQDIQLDKIFSVLGKPNKEIWPELASLPDWRTKNPDKWKNTVTEKQWSSYQDANTHYLKKLLGFNVRQTDPIPAFDLLCKMIEFDPKKRITAPDALEHTYFKEDPLPGMNSFVQPGQPRQEKLPYPQRELLRKDINPPGK